MAKNGGNSGASPQGSQGLQVRKNSFGARAIRDFKKNYEIYLILLPVVAFYLIVCAYGGHCHRFPGLAARPGNVRRRGAVGWPKAF